MSDEDEDEETEFDIDGEDEHDKIHQAEMTGSVILSFSLILLISLIM